MTDVKKLFVSVVIPAAGQSRRMHGPVNKQYLTLSGKPILAHTVDAFENCPLIAEIILVVSEGEIAQCNQQVVLPYRYKKVSLTIGGETRQKSVYSGLKAVNPKADIVMIHDGARPLIQESVIIESIYQTLEHKATVVGVPAKNTIKVVEKGGFVEYTLNRDLLVEIQTPQTFTFELLMKAHENAIEEQVQGTDDAFLVERIGHPVKIVTGHYNNLKITTPEDLIIAESIIKWVGKSKKKTQK